MRKLAIIVCLIGILIGSIFGSLALADSGGSPNYGSSLLDELRQIKQDMQDIKSDVTTAAVGISEVEKQMGNITMEAMSGEVVVAVHEDGFETIVICGDSYPDIRHVYITVGFDQEVQAEWLLMYCDISIVPPYEHQLGKHNPTPSDPETATFEFNAKEWEIHLWVDAYADAPAEYNVHYAATITYPN